MATENKKEKLKKKENNEIYDSAIFEASTGQKLARFIQQIKGARKPTVPIFEDISSQSQSYNIEIENIAEKTDEIPKNNDEEQEKPRQNRRSSRNRKEDLEQLLPIYRSPFKLPRRSLQPIRRRTLLKEFEKAVGTDILFDPPTCSTPHISKNPFMPINDSQIPSPIGIGDTIASTDLENNEDLYKKLQEENERLNNLLKKAEKKVEQECCKKPTPPIINLKSSSPHTSNNITTSTERNDIQEHTLSHQRELKSPPGKRKSDASPLRTPEKNIEISEETPTKIGNYKSLIATPKQRQALLRLINKSSKNDKNTMQNGQELHNHTQLQEIPNKPVKETLEHHNQNVLLNMLKDRIKNNNRLQNTLDKNCSKTQETLLSPNSVCPSTEVFKRQYKEQIFNESKIPPKSVKNDQCNSVVNGNSITVPEAHNIAENIHECTSKSAPIIVIPIHQTINEAKVPSKYKTTKGSNTQKSPLNLIVSTENRTTYDDLITDDDDDDDDNDNDIPLNLVRKSLKRSLNKSFKDYQPTILDLRKNLKLSKTKTRLNSIQDNPTSPNKAPIRIKSATLKNNKCSQKSRDSNSYERSYTCKVVLRRLKNISTDSFQDLSSKIPETQEFVPETQEFVPETREFVPETQEFVPETQEFVPEAEECTIEKCVSSTEKYDGEYICETEECIPATEQCIAATEQCIPATEQCIPATEQCIPATEQCIPATEECVPANEECAAGNGKWVPANEECVPATEEWVPETQENIQAGVESDSLIPETQNRNVSVTDNMLQSSNLNIISVEIISDENLKRSLLPPPPSPFCDLVGLTSFNGGEDEVNNLVHPTESIKKQPKKHNRKKRESTVLNRYLKATNDFNKNRKSNEDDNNDTGNRRKLFTKGGSCNSSDESIPTLANRISSKSSKAKDDASSDSTSVQKEFDNFLKPGTPPAKLKKSNNKSKKTKELINISKQNSFNKNTQLEANGNDNIRQETEDDSTSSEIRKERCQPVEPGKVLKDKRKSKKQNKLDSSVSASTSTSASASASASDRNSAEGTGVRVLTRKRRPPIAYWCNEPIDYYPLYVYNEDRKSAPKKKNNDKPRIAFSPQKVDDPSSEGISSGTRSRRVNKNATKTVKKSLTSPMKSKTAKKGSKKTKTINCNENTVNTGVAPANGLLDSNEPFDSSSGPSKQTSRKERNEGLEQNIIKSRNLRSNNTNNNKSFDTNTSIPTFNSLFDSLKHSKERGEKESTRNDAVVVTPNAVVTPIIRPIQSILQEKKAKKSVGKKGKLGRPRKNQLSIETIIETESVQIPLSDSNVVSNERTLCGPSIESNQNPQITEEDTNFWTNLQQNQPEMANNSKSDELLSWLCKMMTPKSSEPSVNAAVSKIIHHANGFESASVDDLIFYDNNGVQYAFYSGAVRDKIGYMRFFPEGEKKRIKSKKFQLIFIIIFGTLTITCNEKLADFKNGDLITIEKGSTYSIKNNTDDVALTMVVKK